MSNLTNRPYSDEEIDWLRINYPKYGSKCLDVFNEYFGVDYTLSMIKHRCRKYGIKSNTNGRFEKGHETWNKGISIKTERRDIYEKYFIDNPKHFRKGVPPKNTKEIGTMKREKDGWYIKVANPDVWQQYSRYMYEKEHGVKLTSDDIIVHLDKDVENNDISNLALISRSILATLNRSNYITEDPELTQLAINMIKLQQIARKRENKGEENSKSKNV